jgi:hypothetical protein
MKIVCAWCKKNIGSTPFLAGNSQISHGLCEDCRIELEYNFISLEKFIDELNKPIMIVDKQALIQGANQITVKMLQKSKEAFKNQKPGDVIECKYANLSEGCGKTVHCSGCAIRNIVKKTYETGQSQIKVEAYHYLNTPIGYKHMRILLSSEKIGDHVLLQIDDVTEAINSD